MNRISTVLALCVGALLLVRITVLYSANVAQADLDSFQRQLLWLGAGLLAGLSAALLNYRWLRKWQLPWILISLATVLLVAVLVPGIGVEINGGRRWLRFGGQPSELAKVALIIALADYCATHQPQMKERTWGFLYPGFMAGTAVALIFAEPDWGTALLLAAVAAALLLIAGTHWAYILSAGIIGLEILVILLCHSPMRLLRIMAFLDPEKYQSGVGWQGWQSVLAIGAGGLWGRPFGEGKQKFGFVPEQQTDFIFSLIGEELGFVGASLVMLAYVCIIICGLRIAWRTIDPFGQFLVAGITFLIGLQAFINIGVATSSLPNKGIPLPFISYGGSNLLSMLSSIGLVMSVARHPDRPGRCSSKCTRRASPEGAGGGT
ncbi:MAG: cell division protein FtsW [Chloroflexi bacterium]|nr:cell division protein FtsW [Chloroflexota bacterium]